MAAAKEEPDLIHDKDEDDNVEAANPLDDKSSKLTSKFLDVIDLSCCEFCGGPVKKKRHCSPLKRFCSKSCSKNFKKPKVNECGCQSVVVCL